MRCKSCDAALSNKEVTRKSAVTGEFLDLCDPCFTTIADQVLYVSNPIYAEDEEIGDEQPK
jgi:hypothetical protein